MNPWSKIGRTPPYVLENDLDTIRQQNLISDERYGLDLNLFPEPCFGSMKSSVVLLALNPGLSPFDKRVHETAWFGEMAIASLNQKLTPYRMALN